MSRKGQRYYGEQIKAGAYPDRDLRPYDCRHCGTPHAHVIGAKFCCRKDGEGPEPPLRGKLYPVQCDECGCDVGEMTLHETGSFYSSHCGGCIEDIKGFSHDY